MRGKWELQSLNKAANFALKKIKIKKGGCAAWSTENCCTAYLINLYSMWEGCASLFFMLGESGFLQHKMFALWWQVYSGLEHLVQCECGPVGGNRRRSTLSWMQYVHSAVFKMQWLPEKYCKVKIFIYLIFTQFSLHTSTSLLYEENSLQRFWKYLYNKVKNRSMLNNTYDKIYFQYSKNKYYLNICLRFLFST